MKRFSLYQLGTAATFTKMNGGIAVVGGAVAGNAKLMGVSYSLT